jgi:wobble nucleotide-excising tRNase
MSRTLTEIAQQLKDTDKKVQLIYAFNGSGKTRLSQEFKNLIAPNAETTQPKMIYYNAFTEDLFYWDNDLELDAKPKLKIQPNSFTDWILKDQGQDQNIITNFQRYANDKLTPRFNEEYKIRDLEGKEIIIKAFSEVTFSLERGTDEHIDNLKISKGEESNFIWSIFYTLLDQVISILNVAEASERETNEFDQLEYVFIDDPVSSLDENHLIELAVDIAGLIKSSQSELKFIITTHSPLFYNVLYSELKPKSGHILSRLDDGGFELEEKQGASNKAFAYHLHIKNLIEQAIEKNSVQRYHFMLLRNLYEKTSSFLGYKEWADLLDTIESGDKKAYFNRIIQFSSHSRLTNEEISELTEPEKQTLKLLLDNLTNNYGPWSKREGKHA